MLDIIIKQSRPKMDRVVEAFFDDLKGIHTGRASAALVEDIKVSHYNAMIPLKQIASISAPHANLIVISPWDKGALQPIETAIKESGMQINPVNDGANIRISLPPMSEERRKELVKLIHQKAEEAKIALRNIREDSWRQIQKEEKQGIITEDDRYRGESELNKIIAEYNKKVEEIIKKKEQEIMTI